VAIQVGAMTAGDDADAGVLPVSEFGAWAERGELVRVPAALSTTDHAFQWTSVLAAYRGQLIEWGGQAQAVPLAGDGFVIVYRADRLADAKFAEEFRTAFARKAVAPATWEDFSDLAAFFAKLDGKPSIAPMTPAAVADLFFRVAACYDRPAIGEPGTTGSSVLSLQFDLTTGEPRLGTPGFTAAADWLAKLAAAKCLPPPATAGDPVAALRDGHASLAVLSLADLARLPRDNGAVQSRFGIAPLPGTRRFNDPKRGMTDATVPNYIPYLAGGRLGVVRKRCPYPDAAFDLLAELGGPARSLEVVSTPGLGAGPFRAAHLERDRLQIWYGYGFDAERTKLLQDALRSYVRQEVKAPAIGLRGPDQEPLTNAAAAELGKLAGGANPGEVLTRLRKAWADIDAKTPPETRLRWRKMSAGVN
jgi:multiple sugar transport system substrate-binding protein